MKRTRKLALLSGNKQCREYHANKRQWWIGEVESLGLVLTVHGRSDGSLTIDDDTLASIVEYNKVGLIHCCHPKQVAERYPHLAHLIMYSETSGVCCSCRWSIDVKGKGKQTTHVAFANVDAKVIDQIQTTINWSTSEDN